MRRDHEFTLDCHGCQEVAGFLCLPGFEGDVDHLACVEVVEDGVRVRSHDGLKFNRQEAMT